MRSSDSSDERWIFLNDLKEDAEKDKSEEYRRGYADGFRNAEYWRGYFDGQRSVNHRNDDFERWPYYGEPYWMRNRPWCGI